MMEGEDVGAGIMKQQEKKSASEGDGESLDMSGFSEMAGDEKSAEETVQVLDGYVLPSPS